MAIYIYWFLLALVLVGLEMATGTFYLLMVSVAMAVGGLAALAGLALFAQFALAALAGIFGTIILRRWKGSHAGDTSSHNLDIGQPVKILTWREDGTARVAYRGAEWDAELDAPNVAHEGVFHIKAIRGSVLILTRR
jgi:membrane protein implicated in regulation of membrane protease activity